jgi:hypothetical protein
MEEKETKIDGKLITRITRDWLAEFPGYKKIFPKLICKIIGPMKLSIWYDIRYSNTIRPQVSIFNLSNPAQYSSATLCYRPRRRYALTWEQHEAGKYKEALSELREISPIPLEGPVLLSQVIQAYKTDPFIENQTRSRLFEDPPLIAAWAGQMDLAQECLEWALPLYTKNCSRNPKYRGAEEWHSWMKECISDPETLRRNVEEQIIQHKLQKVPREDLIIG